MRDPASGEPAGDDPRLVGALRPQSVVDGQCPGAAAAGSRPAVHQQGERQAVRSAGDRNRHLRPRLETADCREGRGEFCHGQRRGRQRAQQPRRFFSAAARSLIAAPGLGKSWSSWPNATQAFCF